MDRGPVILGGMTPSAPGDDPTIRSGTAAIDPIHDGNLNRRRLGSVQSAAGIQKTTSSARRFLIDRAAECKQTPNVRLSEAAGGICRAIAVVRKRDGFDEKTIRRRRPGGGSIDIGEPLKQFRGVLTGVPCFEGESGDLMNRLSE